MQFSNDARTVDVADEQDMLIRLRYLYLMTVT